MTRDFILRALILAALGTGFGLPASGDRAPELKRWIEGPVRYISRKTETKTFRALSKEEDRALFIERFWARRDPTPESLTNEYRQMFWQRVKEANDVFVDSGHEGWRTDRGKIHILYGPPTEIQEEEHLDTGRGVGAGRGVIRWLYEGRPDGRMDMNPVVVVPFVRDNSGRFRLTHDPRLASVFWDPLAIREGRAGQINDLLGTPGRSQLSVMLDLGKMQEIPSSAQVLLERVETFESYRTHPVATRLTRYRHPEKDGTLVVVTTDVTDVTAGIQPAIVARFAGSDPSKPPRMLGETSFLIADDGERRVAQGRIVLAPGQYTVTVMVADPATAATGMYRTQIVATPPAEVLNLSDPTWAGQLASVDYKGLASHDEPFVLGPYRALPKLDARFKPGDLLQLLYEVYGGQPPYRIAHQLEGRDLDGEWVALGPEEVGERIGSTQAWERATTPSWPLGEYRIRIEVVDQAQRSIATRVPFELVATETP